MNLAENLKKIRKSSGITQTFIAKKINISRQAYCNYEAGAREPDYETLSRIANVLGTTPNDILGITDNKMLSNKKEPAPELYPGQAKDLLYLREIAESLSIDNIKTLIKYADFLNSQP